MIIVADIVANPPPCNKPSGATLLLGALWTDELAAFCFTLWVAKVETENDNNCGQQ